MAKRTNIGQKLPNGAVLIARRDLERHEVVIAMDVDSYGEPTYVTWRVYHQDDNTTSEGHYHQDNFDEAAKDFARRQ